MTGRTITFEPFKNSGSCSASRGPQLSTRVTPGVRSVALTCTTRVCVGMAVPSGGRGHAGSEEPCRRCSGSWPVAASDSSRESGPRPWTRSPVAAAGVERNSGPGGSQSGGSWAGGCKLLSSSRSARSLWLSFAFPADLGRPVPSSFPLWAWSSRKIDSNRRRQVGTLRSGSLASALCCADRFMPTGAWEESHGVWSGRPPGTGIPPAPSGATGVSERESGDPAQPDSLSDCGGSHSGGGSCSGSWS